MIHKIGITPVFPLFLILYNNIYALIFSNLFIVDELVYRVQIYSLFINKIYYIMLFVRKFLSVMLIKQCNLQTRKIIIKILHCLFEKVCLI